MHRGASSKPCRLRWKSIRKISPLHWVPIGCRGNTKKTVNLRNLDECTNCDAGRFYVSPIWDGKFLLKLAVVQIFRGGGVWLQFTSRDYDEPEDNVSSHPTHGAVGQDFWRGWRSPLEKVLFASLVLGIAFVWKFTELYDWIGKENWSQTGVHLDHAICNFLAPGTLCASFLQEPRPGAHGIAQRWFKEWKQQR